MTDQQSQQRINEAADQFTDALVQSYKTVAEPAPSSPPKTAESTATSQPSDAELPLDNYDLLRAKEVADRIEPLSLEEIKRLRDYEAKNQNRRSVLKRMDERINAASEAYSVPST